MFNLVVPLNSPLISRVWLLFNNIAPPFLESSTFDSPLKFPFTVGLLAVISLKSIAASFFNTTLSTSKVASFANKILDFSSNVKFVIPLASKSTLLTP